MHTVDEDRLTEVLDEAACRQLLGTTVTGRLGFTDGALPAILPVPFAVEQGHVVIPALRGSAVVSAVRGAVVVFEVGSWDAATRTGWSVTVVGPTRLVNHPKALAALQLRFTSHPPSIDRCYIAVLGRRLTGWRMSEHPTVARTVAPDAAVSAPTW